MKSEEVKSARVAVLMATYNGLNWISEQLESICDQQGITQTLYVSDDGSTDGTAVWLQANQSKYACHLLKHAKSGGAAQNFFALLKSVNLSEYDYIAFSDQDDIWVADKLAAGIETLQNHKADAYSSNVIAFWPDKKTKLIDKAQPQKPFDYMFESGGPGCTFILSQKLALAIKDVLLAKEQECNQLALHDWFIYAFSRANHYTWFIDSKPRMMYRQHRHNVVGVNEGLKAALNRFKKLQNGWYLSQVVLIAEILGYDAEWPIQCLKKLDLKSKFKLIMNTSAFRRRFRDQVGLVMFLLIAKKT